MNQNTSTPRKKSPNLHTFILQDYRLATALRSLRAALAADAKDYVARVLLAALLHSIERGEEARGLLRQGIEIQPFEPAIYYNLARLLDGCGKTQQALNVLEELFKRADGCPPKSKSALDAARDLYARLQRFLAEEAYEAACEAVEAQCRSVEQLTGCPADIGFLAIEHGPLHAPGQAANPGRSPAGGGSAGRWPNAKYATSLKNNNN